MEGGGRCSHVHVQCMVYVYTAHESSSLWRTSLVITSHALSTVDVVGLLAEMFRRVTCTCSVTRF